MGNEFTSDIKRLPLPRVESGRISPPRPRIAAEALRLRTPSDTLQRDPLSDTPAATPAQESTPLLSAEQLFGSREPQPLASYPERMTLPAVIAGLCYRAYRRSAGEEGFRQLQGTPENPGWEHGYFVTPEALNPAGEQRTEEGYVETRAMKRDSISTRCRDHFNIEPEQQALCERRSGMIHTHPPMPTLGNQRATDREYYENGMLKRFKNVGFSRGDIEALLVSDLHWLIAVTWSESDNVWLVFKSREATSLDADALGQGIAETAGQRVNGDPGDWPERYSRWLAWAAGRQSEGALAFYRGTLDIAGIRRGSASLEGVELTREFRSGGRGMGSP